MKRVSQKVILEFEGSSHEDVLRKEVKRERERERERLTDTQTDRQTERQRDRDESITDEKKMIQTQIMSSSQNKKKWWRDGY